jgi:hypothetical protein
MAPKGHSDLRRSRCVWLAERERARETAFARELGALRDQPFEGRGARFERAGDGSGGAVGATARAGAGAAAAGDADEGAESVAGAGER